MATSSAPGILAQGTSTGISNQPFGAAGVEGIVQQVAVLILIGLGGHYGIAIVDAGHSYRVILAEGNPANKPLGLGRMPTGGWPRLAGTWCLPVVPWCSGWGGSGRGDRK